MRRHRSHSAFATFTAIAFIALVGVALATLSSAFAWQVRRTQQARTDAQLRQLLLAGGGVAAMHLRTSSDPLDLSLTPPDLTNARVRITVSVVDAAEATAEIEARLNAAIAQQTLVFERLEGRWWLDSATLDRPR